MDEPKATGALRPEAEAELLRRLQELAARNTGEEDRTMPEPIEPSPQDGGSDGTAATLGTDSIE